MKTTLAILFVFLLPGFGRSQEFHITRLNFCGVSFEVPVHHNARVETAEAFSETSIQAFYNKINTSDYQPIVEALLQFKKAQKLDDWLFYQLIRKTAEEISPKKENYTRYTLYKWFLLSKSGYDAVLTITGNHILFYVRCNENAYNIPTRIRNGKPYTCLNFHDYNDIDFEKDRFSEVPIVTGETPFVFSYKIEHLPEFNPADYVEKSLQFNYQQSSYHFKIKLNPQIKTIFANYPTVDYESQLNIPLTKETYESLIPLLKRNLRKKSIKDGVDYLMRFTRYAFMFETDSKNFGKEKRLSPEQTLLYEQSDCEDRVALFFYLVKEIYNMPMIVLTYPDHVTIGVQFSKPIGMPIVHNGNTYSICEPTPQKEDLPLGQPLPSLKHSSYEVAYVYTPSPPK